MLRKQRSPPCWHVRIFRKARVVFSRAVLTLLLGCSTCLHSQPFEARKRRGSYMCLYCVFLHLYLHVSVFL